MVYLFVTPLVAFRHHTTLTIQTIHFLGYFQYLFQVAKFLSFFTVHPNPPPPTPHPPKKKQKKNKKKKKKRL